MLSFNMLLETAGIDVARTRLIRHRHRLHQRVLYHDAIYGRPRFDDYQSLQTNARVIEQIHTATLLASFVADPIGHTVFVGIWRVIGRRDELAVDPYVGESSRPLRMHVRFDLQRDSRLDAYRGRLLVDWGGGERAWVQYADRRNKAIIELCRVIEEPLFPGFAHFTASLHEVDGLPRSWVESLRSTRGVYLLTHVSSGQQYVGSAIGGDGLIGRWRFYADGHGGNVALKELGHPASEYRVSILETVGSAAVTDDIYALESLWKEKLGSRVIGLNRN